MNKIEIIKDVWLYSYTSKFSNGKSKKSLNYAYRVTEPCVSNIIETKKVPIKVIGV